MTWRWLDTGGPEWSQPSVVDLKFVRSLPQGMTNFGNGTLGMDSMSVCRQAQRSAISPPTR